MSQVKRFLEKIYDEQDYLSDLNVKIEAAASTLCGDNYEKLENVMRAIRNLEGQSRNFYAQVWLDLEPKIKNEDSEVLSLVEALISAILLSECARWLEKTALR